MSDGKIVTFYSYKGGTGRSMTLANVAWLLALHGKRVLVIDWDLEAPGLHRYLHPFLDDPELSESDGILDFVIRLAEITALDETTEESAACDFEQRADILAYVKALDFDDFPGDGCLHLIGAGRQDASYSRRLSLFNFVQFYERLNGRRYLDATKKWLRGEYDYILLDSRTGVSDTSGICTVQMPDTLVICMTLNEQNIRGSAAVAADVRKQRGKEEDAGTFRIYPVPMRVELSEHERRQIGLELIRGTFNTYLVDLKTEEQRNQYWGQMQVVYIPYYAFEEIPAVFGNNPNEDISMLASTRRIAGIISGIDAPPKIDEEKRRGYLERFLRKTADPVAVARRLWESGTTAERELQKRLLLRFVKVGDGRIPDSLSPIPSSDLWGAEIETLNVLRDAGLIKVVKGSAADVLTLLSEDLIQRWDQLRTWIDEDRSFLTWRQETQASALAWQRSEDKSRLLTGDRLREGLDALQNRAAFLTPALREYINKSRESDPVAIAEGLMPSLPLSETRRLLLRFVNLAGTASAQAVVHADIPSQEEQAVLTSLVQAGVVKPKEDGFELAYPGLVTEWERYREWIEEDREFLSFAAEMQAFATAWQRAIMDDKRLLAGEALTETLRWQSRLNDAPALVRRFLQRSINVDVVIRAESAVRSLSDDRIPTAKMLLLRLVALDADRQFTVTQAAEEDLTDPEKVLAKFFRREAVIRASRLELSDARLLRDWKRLAGWCEESIDFLDWRTRFEARATVSSLSGQKNSGLLDRDALRDWDRHIRSREAETSANLRRLVAASRASAPRSGRRRQLLIAAAVLAVVLLTLLLWGLPTRQIAAEGQDIAHATPLDIGQHVEGSLTAAQAVHYYQIKTPQSIGGKFAIYLNHRSSTLVPAVALLNAAGFRIYGIAGISPGTDVSLDWSPAPNTTYFVQAGSVYNTAGTYELFVSPEKQ